ncbi:thiamine diphosphokinase [Cruoricaptor ignavus]|uniref:thiamine diphosphokinase n=1 Tax=Cruoricaptor ignavus TaxID=1118202 RepID=UPI0009FAD56F|nr:thiamine diphosphokinase [Cruoricaptor ignavus]
MKKSLLFINGTPPEVLPQVTGYDLIGCTDGAFHYLKAKNFPLEELNFISGDFDSWEGLPEEEFAEKIIKTPNQDFTDFQKALQILQEKGAKSVDVFGGSGKEMDHFLGNLSAAFQFKDKMNIRFFDEFSEYFFAPKHLVMENVAGKMISLYPFPTAENITTKGLKWPLNNENLSQTGRIGTRNLAVEDLLEISFESGALLVFIGND